MRPFPALVARPKSTQLLSRVASIDPTIVPVTLGSIPNMQKRESEKTENMHEVLKSICKYFAAPLNNTRSEVRIVPDISVASRGIGPEYPR